MSEFLIQMQFLTGILNWAPATEIMKEWNAVLKNIEYMRSGMVLSHVNKHWRTITFIFSYCDTV